MEKILVTGANGFTGRFLCLELKRRNISFIALIRKANDTSWLIKKNIEFRYGDLTNEKDIKTSLKGISILINLASIGFINTKYLLLVCKKTKVKRVLFVSSTAIFTNLNAKSKSIRLNAEDLIIKSELNWTIIRPTMIYGTPDDRNMIRLIKWIYKLPILPIFGNGNYLQQPIYVKDMAWSIAEIINKPSTYHKSFNISGSRPLTYNQIISIIESRLKRNIYKLYLPAKPFIFMINIIESIGLNFPIKSEQIKRLQEDKSFSYKDAKEAFGFMPKNFKEGILKEIELFLNKETILRNKIKFKK